MRRSWRYLKRRSAFSRASRRVNGGERLARGRPRARRRATAAWCAARAARPGAADGAAACRRGTGWCRRAARAGGRRPGCAAERCGRTTARSPWRGERSRLLSAMSGSGGRRELGEQARQRGREQLAPRAGVGVSACRFAQRRRRIREAQALERARRAVGAPPAARSHSRVGRDWRSRGQRALPPE